MISKESVGVEISHHHLTIAYLKATPFNTKICAQAVYDLDATNRLAEKMDTINGMVKDFLRKQMEMQIEVMSGKTDTKAKQDSLQKLGELLSLNARARDYISAYFRFQQVMQDIYKMIGDAVGEGLDPFAEK